MATIIGQSGKFDITTANPYISGYVEWQETYDSEKYLETKKSKVSIKVYLHRTNTYTGRTYINATATRYAYIGDNVVGGDERVFLEIYAGGSYTEVFSAEAEIEHNSSTGEANNILIGFEMSNSTSSTAFTVSRQEIRVNLTRFIFEPKFEITGAGASSSNRLTLSASNTKITYKLNDVYNETSIMFISPADGNHYEFEKRYSSGDFEYTLTNYQCETLLNASSDNTTPTLSVYAKNSSGNSSISTIYFSIDNAIVPTITNISVTPVSSYEALNRDGLFVRTLTKPYITISGNGAYNSYIKGNYLYYMTGYNTPVTNYQLTDNLYNAFLEVSGPATIEAYVKDSRDRNSYTTSTTFNVIDYNTPSLQVTVNRCNANWEIDNNGTYALMNIRYKVYPINNGVYNYNTKILQYSLDNINWEYVNINLDNWEDNITRIIGGNFDVGRSYTIYFKLTDITTVVSLNAVLPPSKTTESKRAGGNGITWGQIATEDGYHFYNHDVNVHENLYVKGMELSKYRNFGGSEPDANNIQKYGSGFFIGHLETNAPSNDWYQVEQITTGETDPYVMQRITSLNSGITYQRYKSGDWKNWEIVITNGNLEKGQIPIEDFEQFTFGQNVYLRYRLWFKKTYRSQPIVYCMENDGTSHGFYGELRFYAKELTTSYCYIVAPFSEKYQWVTCGYVVVGDI